MFQVKAVADGLIHLKHALAWAVRRESLRGSSIISSRDRLPTCCAIFTIIDWAPLLAQWISEVPPPPSGWPSRLTSPFLNPHWHHSKGRLLKHMFPVRPMHAQPSGCQKFARFSDDCGSSQCNRDSWCFFRRGRGSLEPFNQHCVRVMPWRPDSLGFQPKEGCHGASVS
jgi:hypothetical protein